MDKIWYRNPTKSKVIGCCGGDEKTNDHAEKKNPCKTERCFYNSESVLLSYIYLHSVTCITNMLASLWGGKC